VIPPLHVHKGHVTNADRKAAAARAKALRASAVKTGKASTRDAEPGRYSRLLRHHAELRQQSAAHRSVGSIAVMDQARLRQVGESHHLRHQLGFRQRRKAKAKVVSGHIVSITVTKQGRSYIDLW